MILFEDKVDYFKRRMKNGDLKRISEEGDCKKYSPLAFKSLSARSRDIVNSYTMDIKEDVSVCLECTQPECLGTEACYLREKRRKENDHNH